VAGFLIFTAGSQASRSQTGFTAGFSSQWQNLQGGIAQRAAVSLRDDFRAGLGDWTGSGQWTDSWSFDRGGFVRPGRLALYKPSIPLSNYQLEFSASVEQGGIGWVCRAKDQKNYLAVRLTAAGGDSPSAALIRYRVTNGKAGPRTRTPFPLLGRNTMQSVRMDVQGTEFAVYVDGRLVDHWNAAEPSAGGIGFFSDSGDRARLAWVAVSHQYDALGRLCALLAP